jgi:phosphatidate cytidylyltransferase
MESFLTRLKLDQTFIKRLLVAIVLIPFGIVVIVTGGWVFNLVILLILGTAAWEFWRIFYRGGFHPSRLILITGTVAIAFLRCIYGFQGSDFLLGLIILVVMADQTIRYGHEDQTPAVNFCITLAGIFYLGWLGSYMISIRMMENGQWLLLLVLPSVWLADMGAYLIGRPFGKHKFAPLVSPNKTWEGYLGGILVGVLGTGLLTYLWGARIELFSPWIGMLLGLVISVFSPLGDLGESMIKRQFGVKDSSRILPGHGGIMDRIDSWLWASFLGYYMLMVLL